jgi:hypothetical protein
MNEPLSGYNPPPPTDASTERLSEALSEAVKTLGKGAKWNKSQVLRLARAYLGPFARVSGSDETEVVIFLEKAGRRVKLGIGKAKEGKGAFQDAFVKTFIKPLEAKLKAREYELEQAKKTKEKATQLVEETRLKHEATLASETATELEKEEARTALENLKKNQAQTGS